jgi:hypothetical protein
MNGLFSQTSLALKIQGNIYFVKSGKFSGFNFFSVYFSSSFGVLAVVRIRNLEDIEYFFF